MNHAYSTRLSKNERLFEGALVFAMRAQIKPVVDFYNENGYIAQASDLIAPDSLKMPYIELFRSQGYVEAYNEYVFQQKQRKIVSKLSGWDVLKSALRSAMDRIALANFLTISSSVTSTTIRVVDEIISKGQEEGLAENEIVWQIGEYQKEGIKSRARMIAITEAGFIANASRFLSAWNYFDQNGLQGYKKYRTRDDERVRPSHARLENNIIKIDSDFHFVSGSEVEFAPYPCSELLSLKQRANCRCSLIYFPEDLIEDFM